MNAFKWLVFFAVIWGAGSCANISLYRSDSEYWRGYDMAREFAKKDAMNSRCVGYPSIGMFRWFPGRINLARQAQKYKGILQEQGRSETFIDGFYLGYEESYYEFIDLYCGW